MSRTLDPSAPAAPSAERVGALLDDPQLRPFLPLLWVAWSDGDLGAEELVALRERVDAAPWLRPAARAVLARWLDPADPPKVQELRALLDTIGRAAATLAPERRRDLVALGVALAESAPGEAVSDEVRNALAVLAEQVGGAYGAPPMIARGEGDEGREGRERGEGDERREGADGASAPRPHPALVVAMRALLDGERADAVLRARRFLDDPERRAYGLPTPEYRAKVAGWLAELARDGLGALAFPGVASEAPDLGAFLATFETLALGDLSLLVRYGVQFGLFGGSIYFLGTEAQRAELLPSVASLALPGCFAMSEVGRGSDVQNLETTATWDAATRTFVIHTPREAARKDWIGGAAQFARVATVFAQLDANGERHGVHAFVVPIRDGSGALLEGVRAGDAGHKMGLNGVDNGRLWFDEVRVPEGALLGRFARMNERGDYESPIANPGRRFFTMLGTLVGGRVSVAAGAVATSKVALAIAVRYATARRPFGAADEQPIALLDYPTHGRRLLPRLATTYVLAFALAGLRERFAEAQRPFATKDGEPGDSRELESQAAALKALATTHAVETARACREATGGQGYLSVNRLPALCDDVEIFTTFEGDNTVLLQLVAKSLLAGFRRRFEGAGFGAVVRHLAHLAGKARIAVTEKNPLAVRAASSEHLRDRNFHLAALRFREAELLESAAARLRKRLAAGVAPPQAALDVQEHLVSLARAHADRLALEFFYERTEAVSGDERAWLDRLGALHAIELLRRDAFYLEQGYIEADKARALREESEALVRELRPAAVALVDAFGIPDACLAAPIAFMDPAHPRW